jgi:hypothetical protein
MKTFVSRLLTTTCLVLKTAGLSFVLALLVINSAYAQLINRQFPPSSELAYLSVLQFPDVIVNRKADRLSQGSLIRDQNNRIVLSGTLQGEYLVVYTRGIANEINLVWILREDEVARERERMKQKRAAEREAAR